MATDTATRWNEVKATCDRLEVSPSAHDTPAPSGGVANQLIKQAARPVAAGRTQTSPLSRAYSGVPGYRTAWPKGARQPNR